LSLGTIAGQRVNEGFGTRVLLAGGQVVVGAPFGAAGGLASGRVYTGSVVTLEGSDGAFLGQGLAALGDGRVLVGAPGAGEVRVLGGEVLLRAGPGVGGVLAARGDAWAASTPAGAVSGDGGLESWDRRPDALALDEAGRVWGGFAHGAAALRGPEEVERASPTDEAGYALLFADVRGDEAEELLVGAPGAGKVYVLDPAALPASLADATAITLGSGRFGAALAVGSDGVLYVGAPMAGADVEGAVYAVEDGAPVEVARGDAPGDQLGAALAADRGAVVAGAPGSAAATGSVRTFEP
jgi:hypothetical protein